MLNEHHFYKHDWVCPRAAIVIAVVQVQPLKIHNLFYLPQKMAFWHHCLQVYDNWLMPCILTNVMAPAAMV